jgi:hypothetical protein
VLILKHVSFALQVECKKAQPKEVMLPANLAKTRAAGRGAYGELLMLNPSLPSLAAAAAYRYSPYTIPSSVAASLSGNANNTNLSNNAAAAASVLPSPSVHHGLTPSAMITAAAASNAFQYSRPHAASSSLYSMDMVHAVAAASAAAAAASGGGIGGSASMGAGALLGGHANVAGYKRAMAAAAAAAAVAAGVNRGPPGLTYSMSDLMGLQGLDVSSMYHAIPTMGL